MSEAIEKQIPDNINVFGSGFEMAQRMAKALASSPVVPDNLRDIGSCLIAIDLAGRIGAAPLAVMQNMYIVHGRPAFESKFVISCVNTSGKFSRMKFVPNGKSGDDFGYYSIATDLETGEDLVGTTITWKMVKAEGWDSKNGSKWKTMPEQMFKYRAAAFWQREHAPELTMGIMTRDEAEDITVESEVVKPTLETITEELKQAAPQSPPEPEEPLSPAELSKEKQVLVEIARAFYGESNFMREIRQLCRKRDTDFATATDEQCKLMIAEINLEADKEAMG